jgi:Na+/melibiose symporter-like transporter
MVTTNKKGKILRVKMGYNPNSSSMGSMVFILPAALLAITAGFGVISGIIMSVFLKKSDKKAKEEKQ